MSSDDFIREYAATECQSVRCVNQRNTLVERGVELRAERALVRRILEYAKNRLPADVGAPILEMIARHNLGDNYGPDVRRR